MGRPGGDARAGCGARGPAHDHAVRERGIRLAAVAQRASRDAKIAPAELLDGYVELLAEVSRTGRRVTATEADRRRALGAAAAERGVPFRATVDLYLSATWLAWPQLPGVQDAPGTQILRQVGERVFEAADASIVAVAEGYEAAQRLAVRREEAQRREFVDDLLGGRYDTSAMVERCQRYGLPVSSDYLVVVAELGNRREQVDTTVQRMERDLLTSLSPQHVLVTTKEDMLVCIAPGVLETIPEEVVRAFSVPGRDGAWRVAAGRTHHGLSGICHSFEEARTSLDLARRLGLREQVLRAADLLVFQVLLRDNSAITELVDSVLGPLRHSRLGAACFIDTLAAYFACGAVATVTAKQLHVGVRTVTHRLSRVTQLTGYRVDDPLHRYTLETAVLGARLLGWPQEPREPAATLPCPPRPAERAPRAQPPR